MAQYSILILDDEPEIGSLLGSTLEREGHKPHVVESIAGFEEAVKGNSFDVYLIDLGLPDGNGLNLIRQCAESSGCGVIIISGRNSEIDQVLALEVGADDYVTKPFRPREVVARIHSVMRRINAKTAGPDARDGETLPRTSVSDVVEEPERETEEFDGYVLDISARQLFSPSGEEIVLTTAEFNLLAALLRRRGQVLSRDQLMNAVKGRDWESYDRAIDGLVSRLRQKIPNRHGQSHYIRTVHGVGYSFTQRGK